MGLLTPQADPQEKRKERPDEHTRPGQAGPAHERLLPLVGTWELSSSAFKPGSKGTVVYKSLFGGRFVTEEAKVPFSGFTMEWLGIYGYDENKKKYTAVWVDNMNTTTESAEAAPEAGGSAFRFHGSHVDPRSGKLVSYTWQLSVKGDALEIVMLEDDGTGHEKEVMRFDGKR